MEEKKHTEAFLRKRKFLMVLPLLIVPFVIFTFAALGGGKGSSSNTGQISGAHGLNPELPNAHFKKGKEKDKMAFYEDAGKDSAKIRDAIKKDPYYKWDSSAIKNSTLNNHSDLENIFENAASRYNPGVFSKPKNSLDVHADDPNTKKVMDKLVQLKAVLKSKSESVPADYTTNNNNTSDPDIEQMQKRMSEIKQSNHNPVDPELDQINGMLDKIMSIQHPEKWQDSLRKRSENNKLKSFSVLADPGKQPDSSEQNGFYGLNEEIVDEDSKPHAMEAVMEEDQTLVSGAVAKLRLLQDVYVHGIRIAKDQLIYGISTLSNERLKVTINSVRSKDNIIPVSLEVYDMDGLPGIYVPGSIDRDLSKQSADEAISSIGLTSFDPSLGAQAASAGIQAAKTLISKKVKLVRVSVKAGYKVLLKDNNQK